jgi:glycosyltransferase involved in cell wall biosynthesis
MGHQVTVLTASYNGNEGVIEEDGVSVIRVPCKRHAVGYSTFSEMLSYLIHAFFRLRSLCRETKYDQVHVFFGIPSGPLGWYLKKTRKIPYAVLLGGGDVPGAQERFSVHYKLLGPFLKAVWRNAKIVIPNSKGLKAKAEAFSPDARFEIVYTGVDTGRFAPRRAENDPSVFSMCTVARLVESKGIQNVIKALPAIAKNTNRQIRYDIYGDGPFIKELKKLADSLNVSGPVTFAGYTARERLAEKLSQHDLFVFPSFREGMSNVVLEAMASGLPIVMTNCEGSDELIDGNGIILPQDDGIVASLESALISLASDSARMRAMSQTGRRRAEEIFSIRATASRILELMED